MDLREAIDAAHYLVFQLPARQAGAVQVLVDEVAHLQSELANAEAQIAQLETKQIEKYDFLNEHLKCWMDEGIPAPVNELQSISAWLSESSDVEQMQNKMRNRMLLLMHQVERLYEAGPMAEQEAGIYNNRPDLLEESKKGRENG